MTNYYVSLPFAGEIILCVDAENETEAKEKALRSDVEVRLSGGAQVADYSWEIHEEIVTGNVFHGTRNRIDVEEAG